MRLGRFSFGIGDRFGKQGKAQLEAFRIMHETGVSITPVWNKSQREHTLIGSGPEDVRREADEAVQALGWKEAYFVDADHITAEYLEPYFSPCDYFTLDVAGFLGTVDDPEVIHDFVRTHESWMGPLFIPPLEEPFPVTREKLEAIGETYLCAIKEAGRIYRMIRENKRDGDFVIEVSMDETDRPQEPVELFFLIGMIAEEGIPIRAIAPRFVGRFNKGIDYVGDTDRFAREFETAVAAIQYAARVFRLSPAPKISVHSGSDKFSLYPIIREVIRRHHAGLHLKTAGTTWLEEVAGLAAAGGEGLALVQAIYRRAYEQAPALIKPYAEVVDIDIGALPNPEEVEAWDGARFLASLCHDPDHPLFHPHLRQLFHVAYPIAAGYRETYDRLLDRHEAFIAPKVTENLLKRHLKPLFGTGESVEADVSEQKTEPFVRA